MSQVFKKLLFVSSGSFLFTFMFVMLVFVQRKALRTQSIETTLNSRLGELNNSIPFLCTGLEFNHLNFTERLIKSVDYPIKHFVIILAGFDPSVRRLARWITESFRQVLVVWQSSRIGGTGVFNVCLRYMQEFYGEKWGLIVNNDVYFPSGSLMCMKNKTEQVLKEDPNLCLGFVSFRNMHFGFSAFVATSRLLQYAGYFDENLFPAYYDDNEMDIRLRRVNSVGEVCTRRDIVFRNGFHHGTEEQQGFLSGTVQYLNQHKESSFSDAQRRGSRNNPKYVARKWGCIGTDWDSCSYTRPFNKDFLNVKDWKFDPLYRICIEHGKSAQNDICTYDTELLSSLKQAER